MGVPDGRVCTALHMTVRTRTAGRHVARMDWPGGLGPEQGQPALGSKIGNCLQASRSAAEKKLICWAG